MPMPSSQASTFAADFADGLSDILGVPLPMVRRRRGMAVVQRWSKDDYLAHGAAAAPTRPALQPVSGRVRVPVGSVLVSVSHPNPALSPPTVFFLSCLPDPAGLLYHALCLARSRLQYPGHLAWPRPHVTLELSDVAGTPVRAHATGVAVSIRWCGLLSDQVRFGARTQASAVLELKGVLVREVARYLLHDGAGSAPRWLTDAAADTVRLGAYLAPPTWRLPGDARRHRGWERGQGTCALFLAWLMGGVGGVGGVDPHNDVHDSTLPPSYTKHADTPLPERRKLARRPRPGPFPDLLRALDAALTRGRYRESWWTETCGAPLPILWDEYLAYYR